MNFVKITDFDWLHGNRKAKSSKQIFKNLLLRSHKGKEAETLHYVHDIMLYINCIFIVVAHVLSLLWQLKVSNDIHVFIMEKWKLAFISVLLQIF